MAILTFNLKEFTNISLCECLNYDVNQKLELIVKNAVDSVIKDLEKKDLKSYEDNMKVMVFLQNILLRLSTNNTWLQLSKEKKLDQLYLYKVIRKYLYLKDPEFLN